MSMSRKRRPRRSTIRRPAFESDEAALLAGIAAAPADDAPRLVYADWLDERGEAARAEYLRLVVRLSADPDEEAAVARCVELAPGLDPDWRSAVGAVFEVVFGDADPIGLFLGAVRWLFRIGAPILEGLVPANRPFAVRNLARETAEALRRRMLEIPLPPSGSMKVVVRRMATEKDPAPQARLRRRRTDHLQAGLWRKCDGWPADSTGPAGPGHTTLFGPPFRDSLRHRRPGCLLGPTHPILPTPRKRNLASPIVSGVG